MNMTIRNRFQLSPDGLIHLVAKGEHPWTSADGKERIVQVVDDVALRAMANSFRPEMLVDFEHESHDMGKRTTAGAWISNVEIRADGLWGRPRWSDEGEAAVTGGRVRFISPVFDRSDCQDLGNGRIRPMRIKDAGLTNKPNMKGMQPICNREAITNAGTSEGARKGWETRRAGGGGGKSTGKKAAKARGSKKAEVSPETQAALNDDLRRKGALPPSSHVSPGTQAALNDDLMRKGALRPPMPKPAPAATQKAAVARKPVLMIKRPAGGPVPPDTKTLNDDLVRKGALRPPMPPASEFQTRSAMPMPVPSATRAALNDDLVRKGALRPSTHVSPGTQAALNDDLMRKGAIRPPMPTRSGNSDLKTKIPEVPKDRYGNPDYAKAQRAAKSRQYRTKVKARAARAASRSTYDTGGQSIDQFYASGAYGHRAQ